MRWQQLFADLSAQWEEAEAAAERAEAGSRARAETGVVSLAERLGGAVGQPLRLRCRGVGPVAGVLQEVGSGWLLVADDQGREVLLALAALQSVEGLTRQTAPPDPEGSVRARLDLRWALRALARDRGTVQVVLDDGAEVVGTIDRVGADHVEVAEHPADLPRRSAAVTGVRAVSLAAVSVVRRLSPALD